MIPGHLPLIVNAITTPDTASDFPKMDAYTHHPGRRHGAAHEKLD